MADPVLCTAGSLIGIGLRFVATIDLKRDVLEAFRSSDQY